MKRTAIETAYGVAFALAMALIFLLMLLATGCASATTDQRDISFDPATGAKREIMTKARAATFFAGKQTLANWKAQQSDKTQGMSLGNASQEADAAAPIKATAELLRELNNIKSPAP